MPHSNSLKGNIEAAGIRGPEHGDSAVLAESVRLARVAVNLDEITARLERVYLTDGAALLLAAPAHHLGIGLGRLERLIFEATEMVDDRPRLRRLREAA